MVVVIGRQASQTVEVPVNVGIAIGLRSRAVGCRSSVRRTQIGRYGARQLATNQLTTLDFTLGESDSALGELDISTLDPALRGVLFTDGTVTRALEVQTLAPISVELLEQDEAQVPPAAAAHLRVAPDTPSLRRRVAMRFGESPGNPSVWAESYILSQRLPDGFIQRLDGAPHGIGESLQRLKVESWRDLIWCRLGQPPEWAAGGNQGPAITRLYRVITGGLPALLISECFAVQRANDGYELVARRG